jgi:DNA-binding NtrC family response regulator
MHLGLPAPAHAERPAEAERVAPRTLADAEQEVIREALRANDGNRTHAARLLGIARSTLLEKLKRYGIE